MTEKSSVEGMETTNPEAKSPMYLDEKSIKKLVHPILKGYREFEMTRVSFDSPIDSAFYLALKQDHEKELRDLLAKGKSPSPSYTIETIRVISKDPVVLDSFDGFKKTAKEYENAEVLDSKLTIVEKIKKDRSFLSLALENKSLECADILLKSKAYFSFENKEARFLSDFIENNGLDEKSFSKPSYDRVITFSNTTIPIGSSLAENNRLEALQLLIKRAGEQIDLNVPKAHRQSKVTLTTPSSWEPSVQSPFSPANSKALYPSDPNPESHDTVAPNQLETERSLVTPLQTAIQRKHFTVANLLVKKGADLKLVDKDFRKEYRKMERDQDNHPSMKTHPSFMEKQTSAKNTLQKEPGKDKSI
jgi:hypothetical protein